MENVVPLMFLPVSPVLSNIGLPAACVCRIFLPWPCSLPPCPGLRDYLQAQLSLTVKKGDRLCLGAILGLNCSFGGALAGPLVSVS